MSPPDGIACCSELGGCRLDFSTLPPVPPPVGVLRCGELGSVAYWLRRGRLKVANGSLWVLGQEPDNSGLWLPAEVDLVFQAFRCQICRITAEVDGHGPRAVLQAFPLGAGTQTATTPGGRKTLTLATSPDRPFLFANLLGIESEWFSIVLE